MCFTYSILLTYLHSVVTLFIHPGCLSAIQPPQDIIHTCPPILNVPTTLSDSTPTPTQHHTLRSTLPGPVCSHSMSTTDRPCLKKHRSSVSATSPMSAIKSARNMAYRMVLCVEAAERKCPQVWRCGHWWLGGEDTSQMRTRSRSMHIYVGGGLWYIWLAVCLLLTNVRIHPE